MQQVHKAERHFRDHVDPAQCRAEFDAVENQQLSVHPGQIAQMQVAVAFAHEAVALALAHQRREAFLFGAAPALQCRQALDIRRIIKLGEKQFEVFRDRLGDVVRLAPRAGSGRAGAFREMKLRQPRGEWVDLFDAQFAAFIETIERGVRWELAHFHGVFDGFVRPQLAFRVRQL